MKTDVLLLVDVFDEFRNDSLDYNTTKPANNIASPGMYLDAMLL